MSRPSVGQILQLYKDLLRYGNQLKLTDKSYYLARIKKEFHQNKILTSSDEIQFNYNRGLALLRNGRIL